jgi:hypothetical protein
MNKIFLVVILLLASSLTSNALALEKNQNFLEAQGSGNHGRNVFFYIKNVDFPNDAGDVSNGAVTPATLCARVKADVHGTQIVITDSPPTLYFTKNLLLSGQAVLSPSTLTYFKGLSTSKPKLFFYDNVNFPDAAGNVLPPLSCDSYQEAEQLAKVYANENDDRVVLVWVKAANECFVKRLFLSGQAVASTNFGVFFRGTQLNCS